MKTRIGVLAGKTGWHFRDLQRAAAMQRSIELRSIDFKSLAGVIDQRSDCIADAAGRLSAGLDAVFVRVMPAGSLEQVVLRMDLLNRLAARGVRVVNQPRAVEIAVDKYLSLSMLAAACIPVPQTTVAQTVGQAVEHFEMFGRDSVIKPLFGSLGNGIERLTSIDAAIRKFSEDVAAGRVIYQQPFIDHGGRDRRLLVIGDRVWGLQRHAPPGNWITNVYQGGRAEPWQVTPGEQTLAARCAVAVGCEIAGVDVAIDRATGKRYVLEVNAAPGWQAISSCLGIDIAAEMLTYIAEQGRS